MAISSFLKELFSDSDNSSNPHQFLVDKTIDFLKTDVKIIELYGGTDLWRGTQNGPLDECLDSGNHNIEIEFNLLKSNKIDLNNLDAIIPDNYILAYYVHYDLPSDNGLLIEGIFGTKMGKKTQRFVFKNLSTGKTVDLNVSQHSIDKLMNLLVKVENILKNNLM